MSTITVPKYFTHNSIPEFLLKAEQTFSKVGESEADFTLDCANLKKINNIGLLLIYKFIEFSARNKCYQKPCLLHDHDGDSLDKALVKYGFMELIDELLVDKDGNKRANELYQLLKLSILRGQFIIAPQPMIREVYATQETMRKYFSKAIKNFYEPKKAEMVLNCIIEIALNFWKHALSDPNSILVADGGISKIDIACADTGNGIISTLKEGNENFRNLSNTEVIALSVKKHVTSKPHSNHMGRGLWILDRMATLSGGMLHIYSEGASYVNVRGKQTVAKCGYWKGTIVYMNLPLNKIVDIDEILIDEMSDLDLISLNLASNIS